MGNVHGRHEEANPTDKGSVNRVSFGKATMSSTFRRHICLLFAHFSNTVGEIKYKLMIYFPAIQEDTIIDAGMFDGALGIISALSALKVLKFGGMLEKLRRPVEIIASSDKKGVSFQSTFLGTAAIAGVLPASTLRVHDKRFTQ